MPAKTYLADTILEIFMTSKHLAVFPCSFYRFSFQKLDEIYVKDDEGQVKVPLMAPRIGALVV